MDSPDQSDDERLLAATIEVLAPGPLTFDLLVDALNERGAFDHLTVVDDDQLWDVLESLFERTDSICEADDLVASTAHLLDGITFTHLLTAEELASGLVASTPDLEVIDYDVDINGALSLPGGGICDLVFPSDNPAADENGSFVGPDGWLGWIRGPGLMVFRRTGGMLLVEPAEDLADGKAELDALEAAIVAWCEPGDAFEVSAVLLPMLMVDPGLFRTPIRPITELLDELGYERRGAWFGPRGEPWATPGEQHGDMRKAEIADRWQLEPCCSDAFEVVLDAWAGAGDNGPVDHQTMRIVARALLHEPVSQAFAEYVFWDRVTGSDRLAQFAAELIDLPESARAPGHYLLAMHCEREGDVVAAESHLATAVLLAPEYGTALEEYARYVFDRGDIARAQSLQVQAGLGPGVAEYDYLADQLDRMSASTVKVGRNDPCPCGSGKRFKQCCINGVTLPIEVRSGMLCHKLDRFALRPVHRAQIMALADHFDAADIDLPESVVPMLIDLIASDPAMVQAFLDTRGYLLPDDERLLVEQWRHARLGLYEVLEVEPGAAMTVRDTASGEQFIVTERTATKSIGPNALILTRIAAVGSQHQIIGAVLPVTLSQRQSVLDLLDGGYSADDVADWLVAICRPPTVQNREGDELVMCSVTVRPTFIGWDELGPRLDDLFGPAEGGAWRDLLDPDGEHLVRAVLRRDGLDLLIETNSLERSEDVLERLMDIPGVAFSVIDRVVTPFDQIEAAPGSAAGSTGRSWSSNDDPSDMPDEVRRVVENMVRQQEQQWVDAPVPALGGLTPRQALDDPTRFEDLLALVTEFERRGAQQDPGTTFDVARIRGLLGLE